MKGGAKVVVEQHRHAGVFIARAKEDALCTLNSTPGKDVYGEKRIQVDGPANADGTAGAKIEYRVWCVRPLQSRIAAHRDAPQRDQPRATSPPAPVCPS